MNKKLGLILSLILVIAMSSIQAQAKGYYGGEDVYYHAWSERTGFLWLNKDNYSSTAEYSHSFIVLLNNLSGTKRWENYRNLKKTAQEMKIGISKETTVSTSFSFQIAKNVGLKIPLYYAEVSYDMGGIATAAKTYEKTTGTSSEYVINTNSKNGYYAVTHAVNCDAYDVVIKKNGKIYSDGQLIRYGSQSGYERLWYSSSSF